MQEFYQDQIYKIFFTKLEKAFEKEFADFQYKVTINNLFLKQNVPEIHLEFSLQVP